MGDTGERRADRAAHRIGLATVRAVRLLTWCNQGGDRAAGQAGRTRTNCQDHGMYRIGRSSRRAAHLTLLGIASGG